MTENEKEKFCVTDKFRKKILAKACLLKTEAKFEYSENSPPLFLSFRDINEENLFLEFSKIEISEDFTPPFVGRVFFSIEHRGYFYFEAVIDEENIKSNLPCSIPIPLNIHKVQRRQHFRVAPPPTLPATIISIAGRNLEDKIEIRNISEGGAGLAFPTKTKIPIGTTLPDICIDLANEGEIKLNGIVRFTKKDTEETTLLGLQWSKLTQDGFTKLKNYMLNCQRLIAQERKSLFRFS